ncbi:Hypothetical protein BRZCDTV_363 [Brazilian cedratvirus IHUMI]|uniref:Uncharacterized protein n=1 Tax=Brazilian cedratvirus IHUMI TaxID=2126980 RepID=A0A2R8FEN6_9VIRU|nr:Hypothetical protein BRZCDTV_363 [Brazilian cedratvirus IHUMI]
MQGSWAERAEKELGVPQGYFNLWPFREMGEEERFREVASLYELGPYSSVRLVNGDTVEGVYESYAGLLEAVKRNDVVMVEYFWSRLKPSQKEYAKEHPQGVYANFTAVEMLHVLAGDRPTKEEDKTTHELGEDIMFQGLPVPQNTSSEVVFLLADKGYVPALETIEKEYGFGRELLEATIASGNLDYLDRILPYYYTLPENFSIRNIPLLPFDVDRESFPLYDLSEVKAKFKFLSPKLLFEAVKSCRVQIVDFFRSLYKVDVLSERYLGQLAGFHRRPVDAFCILQRTDLQRVDFSYNRIWEFGDINLILYILLKKDVKKLPKRIIESNLGNIPLLVTLLQLYPNYAPPNPETLEDLEMYPLTRAILYQ